MRALRRVRPACVIHGRRQRQAPRGRTHRRSQGGPAAVDRHDGARTGGLDAVGADGRCLHPPRNQCRARWRGRREACRSRRRLRRGPRGQWRSAFPVLPRKQIRAFPAGRYLVSARDPVGLDGALCWHLPARPDSSEDAHQRGGGDDDARADRGPQERAHDHREGEASPRAVLLALAALGTRPCMKSEISR